MKITVIYIYYWDIGIIIYNIWGVVDYSCDLMKDGSYQYLPTPPTSVTKKKLGFIPWAILTTDNNHGDQGHRVTLQWTCWNPPDSVCKVLKKRAGW